MLRDLDFKDMPTYTRPSPKTASWAGVLRHLGPTGLSKLLNPTAQGIENKLVGGAVNWLKTDPEKTKQLLRGIVHKTVRDSAIGAVGGGVLGGLGGAVTAEPGERTKGFFGNVLPGAVTGAGYGAASGVGGGLIRNLKGMHFKNLGSQHGISPGRVATRASNMGIRDMFGKAFKAPDVRNPIGKLDQSIARAKLLGGAGLIGSEILVPEALNRVMAPEQPEFNPNEAAVYQQPQYKAGSVKTRLRPIDFTNLPSYHT